MVGVFQALAEQIRSEGGSLLATTSRRTPPALAEILRAIADLPHVIWGDGGDGGILMAACSAGPTAWWSRPIR
jgi:mitochondrial fission protein ELM1